MIQVEFHWELDCHGPLPGSSALDAVATVQTRGRAARHFSMYRLRRYAPDQVAECLRHLGWEEIGVWPYGGTQHSWSLRLFCKGPAPPRGTAAHE